MDQLPMAKHHIPQSSVVLVLRIILAVFVIDIAGMVIGSLFFGSSTPFSLTSTASFAILLLFLLGKLILEFIIIGAIVVITESTEYYLTDEQLIIRKGVLTQDELVYELSQIKTVKRHESLLAKILGYGDIYMTFAASGFREDATLNNIHEPKKYEHFLMNKMNIEHPK